MTDKLISLVLIVYSAVLTVAVKFARFAAKFSPSIRKQFSGRPSVAETAAIMLGFKKNFRKTVLFFCSSAGEFEQARPLIDRLNKRGDTFVHVLIFSRSGLDYAKARGEKVSLSLSPATDSVWDWGWIFSALRPNLIVNVRHELWPGFIWSAKRYGTVQLIDASCSKGEAHSKIKKIVRSTILKMFDRIYVVSENDAQFFKSEYGLSQELLRVSGDTKYDRALERTLESIAAANRSKGSETLQLVLNLSPIKNRLIIGSAHLADLELFCKACLFEKTLTRDWLVVIAPHHIDRTNIAAFEAKLHGTGLQTLLFSAITAADDLNNKILILDTMGMLAEVYGIATAAFVGGASHHQIHNVLEPAIHGLSLAWGKHYTNSQEAVALIDSQIARVVSEDSAFVDWLHQAQLHKSGNDNPTSKAVRSFCGATELIYNEWKPILNG